MRRWRSNIRRSPSVQWRRVAIFMVCAMFMVFMTGCASMRQERCFIEDARYFKMKQIFVKSGSFQQVEQTTEAEGWSRCERNELHYRLIKDLDLESYPEHVRPEPEFVP